MIDNKRILAVITARGGSKGLKGKNIMPFAGKPLIAWPIAAAQASQYVDEIIVSTDDHAIAEVAREYNANVPFIRPAYLASDHASSFDVVAHCLDYYTQRQQNFDYVLLLEPTSPFTTGNDIDKAIERLVSEHSASAIVGICKNEDGHPSFNVTMAKNGLIAAYEDKFSSTRRQDLTTCYRYEGSLYLSEVSALLKEKSFYHQATLGYVVPKWQAIEIDDLTDFICAQAIMHNLDKIKAASEELNVS